MFDTDLTELAQALQLITRFKGNHTYSSIEGLEKEIIGKTREEIKVPRDLYRSALILKTISLQIDEIVHATGIANCLPQILEHGEIVSGISLASGAKGAGIDLQTNRRIAEFKFSTHKIKGKHKRNTFADLVTLFLADAAGRKKELYVFNAQSVIKCFSSRRSQWQNVLSRDAILSTTLAEFLHDRGVAARSVGDIYSISNVEILNISDVLEPKKQS